MTYSSLESEYLISLIRCAIKEEKAPPVPKELDWQELFILSKKHQVYSVILPVIDLNSIPQQQAQELQFYSQNELLRMIATNSELCEIEKELEKNNIKFMLLKGGVIRNLYPLQKMRQMSDYDILYDASAREALLNIMKNRDYSLVSWSENSDDFSKKPFYTFEFHRELFFKEHGFCLDFSNVWENASVDENNPCKYYMSESDLYLHTVAHMYKHYVLGGFGIRFLADTYLILTKLKASLDNDYIAKRLSELNLTHFERVVRELTLAVFDSKEYTEEQIDFLNNIMKFGIYGDYNAGVKVYYDEFIEKKGNVKFPVFRYYLSKAFPDRDFMKRTYPVLDSKPYLIGYYYVRRFFEKLINCRTYIFNNIKILRQMNKEENEKSKR